MRHEVRRDVGADVARDERRADDEPLRMHPDAEPVRPLGERSRLAHPGQRLELGSGLVRALPDRLDVDPEEAVAHRRVADDDRLVDHAPVDAQVAAERADLAVERA